jgi:hypothetical protein
MEISKEQFAAIVGRIKDANENSEHEFECVMSQNNVKKNQFTDVLNYLRQSSRFTADNTNDNESLDISVMNTSYRVSINGYPNVVSFCETNALLTDKPFVKVIKKNRIQNFETIRMDEYDLNFKSRKEIEVDDNELAIINETFDKDDKFYRNKKRYSFLHTSNIFRVDLTLVRSSTRTATTLQMSGVLKAPDKYEVEIEYLADKSDAENNAIVLFNIIDDLKQVLDDTDNIMTKQKKKLVLCDYLRLVNPKILDSCDLDISGFISNVVMKNPRSFFLSYQPVTLEQENLLESELGRVSIQENYTVTEKADGERMLMYVDKNNNVYTIDSRLNVRDMGMKNKHTNSLIDGEYVNRSKYNTNYNTFMAFDIYFMDGKDVRDMKLVPNRIDLMSEFTEKSAFTSSSTSMKVKAKKFLHGDNIFTLSKQVYNADKYDYHIDGMIYTPSNLAVGTNYLEETSDKNSFGGAWAKVFKWKPPEENSIDMLTTYGKEMFVPDLGRVVFAQLKVAYRASTDSMIDPMAVLSNARIVQNRQINEKTFVEVYLPIKDEDTKPKSELGETIYNNTIVEYSYDKLASELMAWKPYRVRQDKTSLYQTSGNIAGTANNYNTALNVWRSIINPVTNDMITGKTILKQEDVMKNNVYYSRNISRKKILSKPMLDFHNRGIKSRLFSLFKNKNYALVDLASGKGGDLHKWMEARYTKVVGFDINLDNLMNNEDGAYKRLYQSKKNEGRDTHILFIQKDVSQPWSEIDSIENETMFDLYRLVSDKTKPKSTIPRNAIKFKNALRDGFEVVSCQFAIHYMFRDMDTLKTYCKNVDEVLKPGGYFIGTCLDGTKVASILDDSSTGKITGKQDENTLWMIEKKYAGNFQSKTPGQTISVYVESINKIYDEYLVDLDLLSEVLETFGIRKLNSNEIQALDLQTETSIGQFKDWYDETQYPLSEGLKAYSFLNSWFVFKKQ